MGGRLALVATLLAITSCGASGPSTRPASPSDEATPTAGSAASPARLSSGSTFSRVVVVVMENKAYGEVIGNPDAPYVNALAARFGLATQYKAIAHPSLPNYLALTGGSTFGVTSDCTDCSVAKPNLVDRLEEAGISWKAYMEDMPSPCFKGPVAGEYAKKHDPFLYYDDVSNDPPRCAKVVPMTELAADEAAGTLPRFVWVTPNLCHDMHSCPVAQGDRFLSELVPPLLASLGTTGVLFLVWDESSSDQGTGGGRVPAVVAGPLVSKGFRSSVAYTHYSLLRTIEANWHLPTLGYSGCTCTASMGDFFAPAPATP